jgi:pimeloyl-ACP methyl ester carboxylesterase
MLVRRGFVDTSKGQIHYRSCGAGRLVLLLHQTPRSSDEYAEVLPLLGRRFHAIAMDTVGFGDSYRFEGEMTVERLAEGVLDFLDAMNLGSISLVGHHTGAVIAVEVAAKHPGRVDKLVLSGCPYIDEAERGRRKGKKVVDTYVSKDDGSHLLELWEGRRQFYPSGRPDILDRFIIDALKAGGNAAKGHVAVARYHMEDKLGKISCPTLLVAGTADPFAYPYLEKLHRHIKNSLVKPIEGGTVAMLEQMPEVFAEVVADFLEAV